MIKIALDFDGVLHTDYEPQKDPSIIPGEPVPGAMLKLAEYLYHKDVEILTIHSLRCETKEGVEAMYRWIVGHFATAMNMSVADADGYLRNKLRFTYVKPHVGYFIDDRALRFNGDWNDPQFTIDRLIELKPWNR